MEVLNRFCSTVSSTVSQLQGVLPGNPVTREYEVTKHIASAGPGLLWKIYSGYKKSTKQPASVFVFEKRQVIPQDRDVLIETLKRGIAQLTKLRHPQILVVQHPLEESRDCLAFATEPVFSSLANILGKKDNLSQNSDILNYKLYDVEIKYGLMQIGEGLTFLHKDAKIVHHNLCPTSIIINEQGAWKIFGFDFAVLNSSSESTPVWKCQFGDCGGSYPQVFARPHQDYLAPECFDQEYKTLNPASDIYSMGATIYAIYNDGRSLFNGDRRMARVKNHEHNLTNVAEGLRQLVKMMLHPSPELRPDEHEFLKAEFFEDIGVKALNYLDSLFQWDNKQKSHFYKGLPQILGQLPHRVCLYRVVPCLAREFVNPMMVPFVLPSLFVIAENCNKQEFTTQILPHLKTVINIQDPIQVLLIFMQRMELMLKMTPCEDVKSDVLPLLYRALESDSQDIQELCLSVLPTFAELIEYPAMKNALLPRIKRLCISTSFVSVRVNCLVCIGKLLDYLDKWLVMDEVLPFLPQIPSKEPAVLMGILGIYKLVLNHKKMNMSKEIMAQKVIPFLMPLCVENFLTLNQFNALISVVKEMVSKVEQEHRVKLEQLHDQQQTLDNSLPTSNIISSPVLPSVNPLNDLLGLEKSRLTSTSSTTVTLTANETKPLTFEEKQRIIKEEDATRQLKITPAPTLKPAAAPVAKQSSTIKDLTANLLDSSNPTLSNGLSRHIGRSDDSLQNIGSNINNSKGYVSKDYSVGGVNIPVAGGMMLASTAGSSSNFINPRSLGSTTARMGNQLGSSLDKVSFNGTNSLLMATKGTVSINEPINIGGTSAKPVNWSNWQQNPTTLQPMATTASTLLGGGGVRNMQIATTAKQLSKDEINDLLS